MWVLITIRGRSLETNTARTFLAVQWLGGPGLCASAAVAWVRSLVGQLRPHKQCGKKGKKEKKKKKEEEILQGTRPFGSETDPLGTLGISHQFLL